MSAAGEGADGVPADAENLFVRAFASTGADARGLDIDMRNRIPFARGLGSSAATIAAGVAAGLAWQGSAADPLPAAAALEGHPDNVAAVLLGGVTLAWTAPDGARALRLGACPVDFVAVVAPGELATERARAALPAQVGHADAVHTAARAALLVAALEHGRTDVLCRRARRSPARALPRGARAAACGGARTARAACRPTERRSPGPARRCSSGASRAARMRSRAAWTAWARRRCRWPSPTRGVTVE